MTCLKHVNYRLFLFLFTQMSTFIIVFCLLLIHMARIAPFPFGGPAQQNEDFAYRDSGQSGNAIEERNALRGNGSRNNSLSLSRNRVTRSIHPCVVKNSRKSALDCNGIITVTCKETSFGCLSRSSASPDCQNKITYACGKAFVTDCECT